MVGIISKTNKPARLLFHSGVMFALARPVFAQSLPPPPAYPSVDYHAPLVTGMPGELQGSLLGTPDDPVVITYGGELKISAQRVVVDQKSKTYQASGNPAIQELTARISADTMEFHGPHDGLPATGTATNGLLIRYPYLVKADQIVVDANTIVGKNAFFTTSPPGVEPAYSIRAERLTLTPRAGAADVRNASLYLFGTRVVKVRHYKFQYGGAGGSSHSTQPGFPQLGSSTRYGLFGSIDMPQGTWLPAEVYALLPTRNSPQLRLMTTQPIRIRRSKPPTGQVYIAGDPGKISSEPAAAVEDPSYVPQSTNGAPAIDNGGPAVQTSGSKLIETLRKFALGTSPLPVGDPLLFHQFMPWPITVKPLDPHSGAGINTVEQVAAHVATSGNERDDLYVSRLPELSLEGILPLTPVTQRPAGNDPVLFRQYLRRPVLYAAGSATFGNYFEQPTNIRHQRWQYNAWLNTSPVLIARNTVVVPRLLATYNHYEGFSNSYRYAQGELSLMHYVTDTTAYGFDYALSAVGGSSPFNFDVLDAAQELDARIQVGNRKLAVGGVMRLNVDSGQVFDYRVTVAPNIRGVIPVLTYDFQDKGINTGLALEGITFY